MRGFFIALGALILLRALTKMPHSFILRLLYLLNLVVPKKNIVVMDSYPDCEDQLIALLRWLSEHDQRRQVKVFFFVSGDVSAVELNMTRLVGAYTETVTILSKRSLRAFWVYVRAKTIFYTHGLYGYFSPPGSQCVINLWHGMPVKGIWKAISDDLIPRANYLCSTSSKFSGILAGVSGVPRNNIVLTGLPRNDVFFKKRKAVKDFFDQIHKTADRTVMFLPTFRASNIGEMETDGIEAGDPLGMGDADLARLLQLLEQYNVRVFVKPHPMSIHYGRVYDVGNISVIDDAWLLKRGITLYEMLSGVDALITDISSVYVDFLITRRPCFCFFPDVDAYRKSRNFLLDPIESYIPSELYRTGSELIDAISVFLAGDDRFVDKRNHLAELLNPQEQDDACARVFALAGFKLND